jgi:hypothetical protein
MEVKMFNLFPPLPPRPSPPPLPLAVAAVAAAIAVTSLPPPRLKRHRDD